jgi:cell division septum initiation protein DivIVA
MNEGSESVSKEYIEDRIEQLERDNESLREQVNDLLHEVNDLYERENKTVTLLLDAVKELQEKVVGLRLHQLAHPIE